MIEKLSEAERDRLSSQLRAKTQKLKARVASHFVDDKNLCSTCTSSHVFRRKNDNKIHIRCDEFDAFVPSDIQECNRYDAYEAMSLGQFINVATFINGESNVAGFDASKT